MKTNRIEINYIFFSFFFLILLTLSFFHYSRMSTCSTGMPLLFLFYALGQAFLEMIAFIFIGYLLRRFFPSWVYKIYIGLSFGFLLAYYTNYTLVRLMDVSIAYFFSFFFGCGIDHFLLAFSAANLNSTMIAIIICALVIVPAAGIFFYTLTNRVSLKKPLKMSSKQIFVLGIGLTLILFVTDIATKPYLSHTIYHKYKKMLPFGSTFLSPKLEQITLKEPIAPARNENEIQQKLSRDVFSCPSRPNIYLFVIEALRHDFINSQVAPNLLAFANQNLSPACSFSNANTTHLSWFSIFHANYPYNWTEIRDHWKQGSIPLQILKKMGYQIRVYSAANLSYFNMDHIIFGHERELADSIEEFSSSLKACDRDQLAIDAVTRDALKESDSTLFIIFLDSTHSEYSAPDHFIHPFQPECDSISYLTIDQTKDIEPIKNRYRNSIYWVDHLLGTFFHNLQENNRYDQSMIVLTGDHGEEFFEDGALFHGTHLNVWQTSVPLFYKIPFLHPPLSPTFTTHLDIFPTILHLLTNRSNWDQYFDGQSLFDANHWPYALSVQHNGPSVPYEFALNDGQMKLNARFINPPLIHSSSGIEILSAETADGHEISLEKPIIQAHFSQAFDRLFAN